jgi:hypothetical protein
MAAEVTMTLAEYNAKYGAGKVRKGVHSFAPLGRKMKYHWPVCRHCGLVALKNEKSRKAAIKPCVWIDD